MQNARTICWTAPPPKPASPPLSKVGGAQTGCVTPAMFQESPRQTKPKKGQFMNFSRGHSVTKVRCESRLFSQGKTPEFTKMGEIHELFVVALSLVWFAGATPECLPFSSLVSFSLVRESFCESGESAGKFGKLPGNLWIAVKFHSERTSGEVAEKLPGKFGELPGKPRDFPEARGSVTPSKRLAKFVSNSGAWGANPFLDSRCIRHCRNFCQSPLMLEGAKPHLPQELRLSGRKKAHKHKLFVALVNVQMALGQRAGCPRVNRAKKFMCVRLENTGNIKFSLWLTGGLSQGCPDFQKVYVFKVYVPFSCPSLRPPHQSGPQKMHKHKEFQQKPPTQTPPPQVAPDPVGAWNRYNVANWRSNLETVHILDHFEGFVGFSDIATWKFCLCWKFQ